MTQQSTWMHNGNPDSRERHLHSETRNFSVRYRAVQFDDQINVVHSRKIRVVGRCSGEYSMTLIALSKQTHSHRSKAAFPISYLCSLAFRSHRRRVGQALLCPVSSW